MEILILFIPSLIGLNLYLSLKKDDIKENTILSKYGTINIITNLSLFIYIGFTKGYKSSSFIDICNNLSFNIKYIIFSSILSLVVGYIMFIIEKSIEIDVKVQKKKKK